MTESAIIFACLVIIAMILGAIIGDTLARYDIRKYMEMETEFIGEQDDQQIPTEVDVSEWIDKAPLIMMGYAYASGRNCMGCIYCSICQHMTVNICNQYGIDNKTNCKSIRQEGPCDDDGK